MIFFSVARRFFPWLQLHAASFSSQFEGVVWYGSHRSIAAWSILVRFLEAMSP